MKLHKILLAAGIIILAISAIMSSEDTGLIKDPQTVEATITKIDSHIYSYDAPHTGTYEHIYYGNYALGEKEYKNQKLDTKINNSYSPDMSIGDTININISEDIDIKDFNVWDFVFVFWGIPLTIYSIVVLVVNKRKSERTAE